MAARFADAGRGQAPQWVFSPAHGPSVGLTAAFAACALAAAATVSPEAVEDGLVICPFRLMTGLPCPGCGLARSWVHLLHGHLVLRPAAVVALGGPEADDEERQQHARTAQQDAPGCDGPRGG